MRRLLFIYVLVFAVFAAMPARAQVNVSVNIGAQPLWGPVGYSYVEYYYLPDIELYYNVPRKQYVYLDHGRWLFASALPTRYRGYDFYTGYKVVINEPKPYLQFRKHKVKYARLKGHSSRQALIRNNYDPVRYSKGHPHHQGVILVKQKPHGPSKDKGKR
jgi:hypothetical protein